MRTDGGSGRSGRAIALFGVMAGLLAIVGVAQSWSLSLTILNLCLISGVMSLGVNIQWGFAGLFNIGVMGFAALGGLAGVLVSHPPVVEAWRAGGGGLAMALLAALVTIAAVSAAFRVLAPGRGRAWIVAAIVAAGYVTLRLVFDPAADSIESVDPSRTGFIGGLGAPILLSWIAGGALAAGAAWIVGKISLGLRADYLAIATLGISEIVVALIKNEEWLARGVKNVVGLPRPVPYEIDLQQAPWFQERAASIGADAMHLSSIVVKLSYAGLFIVVLLVLLWLAETALRSPWGRMMRAIRDNEVAAEAMGKDVTARHLQVFVLGSAVIGVAGAMLVTLDGQFTPPAYQPLRYTFLIWVMVIVGGSGNNFGAILGGFVVWFLWIEAEPVGVWFMDFATSGLAEDNPVRRHLIKHAAQMRLVAMGVLLLVVLRFAPAGLIPERRR